MPASSLSKGHECKQKHHWLTTSILRDNPSRQNQLPINKVINTMWQGNSWGEEIIVISSGKQMPASMGLNNAIPVGPTQSYPYTCYSGLAFPLLKAQCSPHLEAKNWWLLKMQGDMKIYSQEKQLKRALTMNISHEITDKQHGRRRDRPNLECRHLITAIDHGQHLLYLHLLCLILLKVKSRPKMKPQRWILRWWMTSHGYVFHLSVRDEGKKTREICKAPKLLELKC